MVKAIGQEDQEGRNFTVNARRYRDSFVEQGLIQARYLPTPLLASAPRAVCCKDCGCSTAALSQSASWSRTSACWACSASRSLVSIFSFSLVHLDRERELAAEGHARGDRAGPQRGRPQRRDARRDPVRRRDLRTAAAWCCRICLFTIEPGQTVAIVGETGSGKTTATKPGTDLRRRQRPDHHRRHRRAGLEPGLAAVPDLHHRAGHRAVLPAGRRTSPSASASRPTAMRSFAREGRAGASSSSPRSRTATTP